MITWNNLDTLESFKELSKVGRVDIKEAMSGDNGAKRVKEYNIPMAEGFTYNFAAKQVDEMCLRHLQNLQRKHSLQRNLRHFTMGSDQYRREPSGSSSAYPWTARRCCSG